MHERIIASASASSARAHPVQERIKCTSALLPARAHQVHERIIACASASSARAHYCLRERIQCTSALLPARAHPVHERIIARASASSARAHYCPRERIQCTSALLPARAHLCKTHEIVSQMVSMDIATNVEYSGTCVCLNPCIFPCM